MDIDHILSLIPRSRSRSLHSPIHRSLHFVDSIVIIMSLQFKQGAIKLEEFPGKKKYVEKREREMAEDLRRTI